MSRIIAIVFVFTLVSCSSSNSETASESQFAEPQFFELRTYYCNPGKLDDLLLRFSDHTMRLFEKHGMTNVGYWVPLDNTDDKLVYLMGYPGLEERNKSWDAFMNDPEWAKVYEASRANGPIVDSVVSTFLHYTEYSPKLQGIDNGPRIFSHRTYYTHPGKLEALHRRFEDHTLEIFENSGMVNVAYFQLDSMHEASSRVLTYLITSPDTTHLQKSWDIFGKDPAWRSAYEQSILNGPLVDSITDELMIPTAFSPLK